MAPFTVGSAPRPGVAAGSAAESLDRLTHLVEILPDLRQAQHRLRHAAGQHVERHQLAHRQFAVDDGLGAEIEDAGGRHLGDQLDRLTGIVAEVGDAERGADIAGQLLFPAALHLRLHRHRLQGLDAGHGLHQEGLVLRAALEFLLDPRAEQRRQGDADAGIDRQRHQHDDSQPPAVPRHHREKDHGEEEIDDQGQAGTGDELADVLQLAHARDRIADAARSEIGERQRHQVAEQARAQLNVDAVGGVREDVGAERTEHSLEDRDGDEADQQHVERRHAAMHQHLVHHHLEEQGRDQREDLQEERGEQDLAQQVAVLVDRAHEPGDAELPAEIRQGCAARDENEGAVPDRFERALVHHLGGAAGAAMHQHLVLVAAAEDEKAAVVAAGQSGQRCSGQAVVRAGRPARLQILLAREAHDVVGGDRVGAGQLATERVRAHGQAMKAEQSREAAESPLADVDGRCEHLACHVGVDFLTKLFSTSGIWRR
jgi:hypothetical protein